MSSVLDRVFFPLFFPASLYILPAVLEEELEPVRREVTDLQRRLDEVEDQREALEEGVLAVFRVVGP